MRPTLEGPVPDYYLEDDVNFNCKIILEPSSNYFINQVIDDRKNYDKLLLIHGLEPPLINDISKQVIEYHQYFDKILSFDNEVLHSCLNSELFCFGSCWILTDSEGKQINLKKDFNDFYKTDNKTFTVSFIKSNKTFLEGHRLRSVIPPLLINKQFRYLYPTQRIETKIPLFIDSMFHITVENSKCVNYFTEKIIDCFMSKTIPIYWGCPNIGDYFDSDGIICFNDIDELNVILTNLNELDYNKRLEIIEKNYEKAKDYAFFFDRINNSIKALV